MKADKSLLIKKRRLLIVKKEKKKKVISMITQIRTNKSFINLICVDKKFKKKKKCQIVFTQQHYFYLNHNIKFLTSDSKDSGVI